MRPTLALPPDVSGCAHRRLTRVRNTSWTVTSSAPLSPGRTRFAQAFVAACAACALLAVSAAPAANAAAPVPCWKLLLNDWYTPPISKTYPIHCYHEALSHLPRDVGLYSSARDDIIRALQSAIAAEHTGTTTTTSTSQSSTPTTTSTTPTTTTTKKKVGPIKHVIKDLTPGGADSFPLPLLILGLLAILLVLAGLGGMAWRRYQGRRGPA
jgi:hypothetical protein